jgi:multidrug efflux pump subunit AcrB
MLTGTLVTAAGFLPIGFANSAVGEYAGGIFWVVAIALVASWFVAVIFTPYLGVKLLSKHLARHGAMAPAPSPADPAAGESPGPGSRLLAWKGRKASALSPTRAPAPLGASPGEHAIYETRGYNALRRVVQFCVCRRGLTVLATLAIFVAAVGAFGRVQQQFFPLSERPELFLQLRLPEGTAIGVTAETARQAERLLGDDTDIATHTTYIGQGSPRFWLGLNPQLPNEASPRS